MTATLIIKNARIYTLDPQQRWAQAVACSGGRIAAVGTDDDVLQLAKADTQIVDANGRLVLPGLIDAHVHFLPYAIRQHEVSLYGVRDFAEVRQRIAEAVGRASPGTWVQGWGWDENLWGMLPTRAHLDDMAPHTPVVLSRVDMHTWWVNSAALRAANVTQETPDPPESRIERDSSGAPTGILREWNAIRLIQQHIPEPDHRTLYGWLRDAIKEAHRLGLTGIHDQRVQREGRTSFHLLQELRQSGELKLRVHMNIAAEYLSEVDALGLRPGFGDERLWIGHVKAFADGTMGSRTALMLEPFEGEPENTGVAVTPQDELWELARRAEGAGYSLSVHAIGDRAVRVVIDVMSEFPRQATGTGGELPHRIEHVQVIHPHDLARLSEYGIVASMQPVHLSAEWDVTDRTWGGRSRHAYAFRSLLDRGTKLAFGSDAPVAPLNPMFGIFAAVARQDTEGKPEAGWYPQERLSVAETIQAYTLGPAYTAGQQHRQGSITAGKWADMIVLSQDLFAIPPREIPNTEVEITVFNGEIVHHNGNV